MKLQTLGGLRNCRIFDLVAGTRWRTSRLLILCYHGISLSDEHLWNPGLYMSRDHFAARLKAIKDGGYRVLPLAEAIRRLYMDDLPPKALAITFDDGLYDFYAEAWPLLADYGFPATVYLTTYYCDYNRPVFRLICDYMIWQKRGVLIEPAPGRDAIDLRTPESRAAEINKLDGFARTNLLSARQKDQLAQDFARRLGADWEAILRNRVLHIMNPAEAAELSRAGVDLQLHTHRHRTPGVEALFCAELDDNAARLYTIAGEKPTHFCYPSGVHHGTYPEWLRRWGVESAVTCDLGIAEASHDVMLLPRLCDHDGLTPVEFEAWLCGLQRWLPKRYYPGVEPD